MQLQRPGQSAGVRGTGARQGAASRPQVVELAACAMSGHKQYTRADVLALNKPEAILLAVHNQVYDVTPFLGKHPGGREVLVGAGGQDATRDFDDIGHSVDARELMKKYLVGEIVEEERVAAEERVHKWDDVRHGGGGARLGAWRLPLLALAAALLWLYLAYE